MKKSNRSIDILALSSRSHRDFHRIGYEIMVVCGVRRRDKLLHDYNETDDYPRSFMRVYRTKSDTDNQDANIMPAVLKNRST